MKNKLYSEMEQKATWALCNAYEVYNELKSRGKNVIADEMNTAIQHLQTAQNYIQWLADSEEMAQNYKEEQE